MDDLFASEGQSKATEPLAARMRPEVLDEFVGQQHIIGPGKLLRRTIEADRLTSIILYGPPGCGKTSLAKVIARVTKAHFAEVSGVEGSVADLRKVLASALHRADLHGQPTILFIDEIHRFTKPQQDVLLPDVEKGVIKLIGATTHNPFFYVNSPLVSRSQVFQLEPLEIDDLQQLMKRALGDCERGLGSMSPEVSSEALAHLAAIADGDARRCLNALEVAVVSTSPAENGLRRVTLSTAEESIQTKAVVYDAAGDAHYDTASAFIKSLRGSDPDASIYWLALMLHAGEDPRFIARRLVIAASEDIGLADSRALLVAVAAQQAVETIGLPEAELNLAHATLYLATAPKSNSSTRALGAAKKEIARQKTLEVPRELRDSHYAGASKLGHGEGYKNPHAQPGGTSDQRYLPEERSFYAPSERGEELRIQQRLEWLASKKEQSLRGKQ